MAAYLSVFYGSCCRTNQAVAPQGDHSLLPPAVYIPTHSAPGLGRGRKWSHTACAYVTQYGVLEINQVVCWGLKLPRASDQCRPKSHWVFSCRFSTDKGSRWQDHLNVAVSVQNWIKVNEFERNNLKFNNSRKTLHVCGIVSRKILGYICSSLHMNIDQQAAFFNQQWCWRWGDCHYILIAFV